MQSLSPTAHRRPMYAVAAVLMLLGLALVPLPGISQGASLAQLGRGSAWWMDTVGGWPPAFSPLSTGLLGLVLARFALDTVVPMGGPPSTRRLWAAIAQGLYLGASFAGGVAMGLTLESRFPDLVVLDGLVLGVLLGAIGLITAAALWSMASLIRRSGVASGALLLFGVWEIIRSLRFIAELLLANNAAEPDLGWLAIHTGALPLGLTLLALWRWVPHRSPLPVIRSLALRGPLDVLFVPLAVGALAGVLTSDLSGFPSWTPQPPIYDPGTLARTVAALLVVPALGFWLRRQPGRPGAFGWAILGFVLLAATAGLWIFLA
ncbi:MAG: hypothetical protein AB8H79_21025 [Myxococcota bacterium]